MKELKKFGKLRRQIRREIQDENSKISGYFRSANFLTKQIDAMGMFIIRSGLRLMMIMELSSGKP